MALRPSPIDLFDTASTVRALRIDGHWRCVTLMAKAHGTCPDSRWDCVMEGFAANYVLRGRGTYRDAHGAAHPLTPGTLFQRLPGRRHSTLIDPASDYAELFLVLDPVTAHQLLGLGLIPETEVLPGGADAGVLAAFRALQRDLARPEDELPARAALARVVGFLSGLYDRARPDTPSDSWEHLISRARVLLERDLGRRVDMTAVAESLQIAYPTFRRRFREAVGVSPGAYRVRCRLEQARILLPGRSVKQVAAVLGYGDPFTFSAQFRTHFGVSPRHYQEQQRRSEGG